MNKLHKTFVLSACAAVCAFSAPRAAEEEIAFRPEAGAKLVFAFDSQTEMSLIELAMTQNGEEWEGETPDVTITYTEKLEFTDEIVEAADGRATKLRRSYAELAQTRKNAVSTPEGDQSDDSDASSPLSGKVVVFTWDAEAEEYTAEYEDEEGDADLLDELEGKVDFGEFLPTRPVSKDDTWTADAQAFNKISSPGGDLGIEFEGDESDEEGDLSDQMNDNMQGEILCKLVEVREEDGVRIAVIGITADLNSHGAEEGSFDVPDGPTVETTQDAQVAFDLEGELLWNLTAGHAVSFELGGTVRYEVDETQAVAEADFEGTRDQVFEGTFSLQANVE